MEKWDIIWIIISGIFISALIFVGSSCIKEIEITKYKEQRVNLSITYGGPALPDTIILRGK